MSINDKLTIINRTELVMMVHDAESNKDMILVKSKEKLGTFANFKSIYVYDSQVEGERWILLTLVVPTEDISPWFDLIASNFKGSLLEALNNIKRILDSTSATENYLKFRGDYAEALFVANNDRAIKLSETETADIELDGVIYEIKSFSPSKNTVNISMKQIMEDTTKLALPLLNDSNGFTILELADKMDDRDFAEYLYSEYSNSKLSKTKYKAEEFVVFNNLLPLLDLPSNIKEAEFIVDISKNLK